MLAPLADGTQPVIQKCSVEAALEAPHKVPILLHCKLKVDW